MATVAAVIVVASEGFLPEVLGAVCTSWCTFGISGLVGASVSLLRLVVVVAASVTVVVGLLVTVGVSSEAVAGTLEVLGTVVVELKSGEWGLATFPAVVVAGSRLVLGK